MLVASVSAMVRRWHGRVFNLASIAAFVAEPRLAAFAASKAYALSLTESLSEELRDTGVTVTALCPGIPATATYDRAAQDDEHVAELPDLLAGSVQEETAFCATMRNRGSA